MMQGNILLSKPNESICAKAKESSWEFAPESTYFIGTECNSCPKAITVKAWCLRRALSVTGKPKLRFPHLHTVEIEA